MVLKMGKSINEEKGREEESTMSKM